MNDYKIELLTMGFNDFYARVGALEEIFQEILKPLKEGDVLLIEGENGAPTYLGYVKEVHLPDEHYKGTAAIPFVLNNKYGLGIPIEFQDGTLKEVVHNIFMEPSSEDAKSPINRCGLYSDFKAYAGIADVDKQLHSAHGTTLEKFVESLEKK